MQFIVVRRLRPWFDTPMQVLNCLVVELGAVYDNRLPAALKLFAARDRRGRFSNRNRMNRRTRHGADVPRINAVIDDDAITDIEIIDGRGLVVDSQFVHVTNAEAPEMRAAKIFRRHECEKIHADAEIKSGVHNRPVKNNPHAVAINRMRRQRRPATVIIRVTPANP